jgi:hypothetical protein
MNTTSELLSSVSIPFMPNGSPCPMILTSQEVIELLRLSGEHPERCLKYYRDMGMIKGIRIGKQVRYPLVAVMDFINKKLE